jgi:phosphatidylserine/phosphatidylglycerophosphate/cardiolipin synthase-like enzyme
MSNLILLRWRESLRHIAPRMRLLAVIEIILVIVIVIIAGTFAIARAQFDSETRVVYSLDRRQNDQEIIRLINDAKKYVYFAIYYFSQNNIADALIRAKERGIDVRGITDREASLGTNKAVVEKMQAAGISVEMQRHMDGIMHVKAMVTDSAYASGSYNWTSAATEANDEVLEIGTNRSIHDQYLDIIRRIIENNQ